MHHDVTVAMVKRRRETVTKITNHPVTLVTFEVAKQLVDRIERSSILSNLLLEVDRLEKLINKFPKAHEKKYLPFLDMPCQIIDRGDGSGVARGVLRGLEHPLSQKRKKIELVFSKK